MGIYSFLGLHNCFYCKQNGRVKMAKKIFFVGFSCNNDDVKDEKVSIDVYYQEKYNEMRRHRDYLLSTANWCTVILLAIIAGFVSLNKDCSQPVTQFLTYRIPILKFFVVLFIIVIFLLGRYIINYSANRYEDLRKWVTENIEPTVRGKKYDRKETRPIQKVIIAILAILGILASLIVLLI